MDNDTRQYKDFMFFYEYMSNQQDLDNFINESLVLSSGNTTAVNRLRSLNEASDGKLKNFFTRIKQFFQKIFGRLTESIKSKLTAAKEYIDNKTYNPIIFKRKYHAGDVKMVDHFTGVRRVLDFFDKGVDQLDGIIFNNNTTEPAAGQEEGNNNNSGAFINGMVDGTKLTSIDAIISTADAVSKAQSKTKDDFLKKYVPEIMSKYGIDESKLNQSKNESGNISVDALFTSYFQASGDPESDVCDVKTFPEQEINDSLLGIMVTFVYNGTDLVNKIASFQEKVNAKFDKAYTNLQKEIDSVETSLQNNIKSVKTESYKVLDAEAYIQSVLHEDAVISKGSTPTGTTGQEQDRVKRQAADAVGKQVDNANKSLDNKDVKMSSSAKVAGSDKFDNNTNSDGSIKNKIDSQQIQNAKTAATNISKFISGTCINEANAISDVINTMAIKMKACLEYTLEDYFSVIQAHVKWYINNPSENNNTNQFNRTTGSLTTGSEKNTKA